MKRPVAFYPPIAAAFPVLAIFSANLTLCPLSDLWAPLGISIAASVIVWLILGLISRSWDRGAIGATIVVIFCFTYAPIAAWFKAATSMPPLYFWVPALLIVALAFMRYWRWHKPLNILASALALTSVGSILFGYLRIHIDESRLAHAAHQELSSASLRPDIYYIILDGYGREDQLKRVMQFDDSDFISGLQQRGFYVAANSHSNYVQTELSLASSLNMDFIPNLLPSQPVHSDDREPLDQLANKSAVSGYLRTLGYEYIAITSGFPSLVFTSADLQLGSPHRISLLESTLASMTPLSASPNIDKSEYLERRDFLASAFTNLTTVGTEASVKPRFVFVHVLAPHPPFVVNADGSQNIFKPEGPFGYWDGSDFFEFGNTQKEYRDGYVNQVEYVNRQTLAVIDAILAKSSTRPIILVQGDHGSKLHLSQNSLAKTDLTECMSNLMAYEVPDEVKAKLYPEITPVNSFRIILSTLFGANYPNLQDESWFSTFEYPYQFIDVTNRLKPTVKTLARAK